MWAVVGLGNPGQKYLFTRHNIGFMIVDSYLRSLGISNLKNQFKAETVKARVDDLEVLFLKPQTYMNLSGESVQKALAFYKISPEKVIVIHDDIDQPYGQVKIQFDRGAGGHNGIKSITQCLGTQKYYRLKIGVGRPPHPKMDVADYVLAPFSKSENETLNNFIELATQALDSHLFDGFKSAANKFNSKSIQNN